MSQNQLPDVELNSGWAELLPQLRCIEQLHLQYSDAETPQLPQAVVAGARRLIHSLEAQRETPPTIVSGSCDATIVFEWHDWESKSLFRSLEVLNENEAEEFIFEDNGRKTLRSVIF